MGITSLALGVLGVGDRVADNVLEEDLEYASGLYVERVNVGSFHLRLIITPLIPEVTHPRRSDLRFA